MNKYKYRVVGKPERQIWVCEACKKGKILLIQTGKWKLLDMCGSDDNPCDICEEERLNDSLPQKTPHPPSP